MWQKTQTFKAGLDIHRDFICPLWVLNETLLACFVVFNGAVCPSDPSLTSVPYAVGETSRALNKVKECEQISGDPRALMEKQQGRQPWVVTEDIFMTSHVHIQKTPDEFQGPLVLVVWPCVMPFLICLNFSFLICNVGMIVPTNPVYLTGRWEAWRGGRGSRPLIHKE